MATFDTFEPVHTTQSVSTIQSVSTVQDTCSTQPTSTTKPQKYIVITGLGKKCVALKSQVSNYESLINYIRASFPGTYYRSHFRKIPLPIGIQTCDLPVCKGNSVDVQPAVWATIIADINSIEISIVSKSKT
ncbi:hypothetical protein IW261DRAFT_1595389 [Armillaria novae-zelandiae]|uniref:Uncharacterized protein n=1 Tax=Armillaria novae-zelandiae TaxID=153914 RepID=A0AA39UE73_9AGAR|nr:hypothetical protein IW261DRAFT_1595389 [Armillaria novae-zelandiae]